MRAHLVFADHGHVSTDINLPCPRRLSNTVSARGERGGEGGSEREGGEGEVRVCVWERARERKRKGERETGR
eukprot:3451804-Rhodomonas_salina.1